MFEIEVLNAIKRENTAEEKKQGGDIFSQFFQIKAGNFITRAAYFTQAITRLMHLQRRLLTLLRSSGGYLCFI